jgi:hypothetical protein
VENALRAFSTQYTKSSERRRCEQAILMGIRQTLNEKILLVSKQCSMIRKGESHVSFYSC